MNNLINIFLSSTSKSFKKLWLILMISVFMMNMSTNTAFADVTKSSTPDQDSGKTVPTDPNRPLSPEEIKLRDAKYRALNDSLKQPSALPSALPSQITLSVGTWKEPNDAAHVNYCGPGATQVALDARWAAASVYGIDKIGVDEKTNVGSAGTNMVDIGNTLNSSAYLGNEFPNPNGMQGYWLDRANTATDLRDKVKFDISHGYVLITGVMTTNMPGWNGYTAKHIVGVYGYSTSSSGVVSIQYTDTAAVAAGYTGSYKNSTTYGNFYSFVSGLNTLIW